MEVTTERLDELEQARDGRATLTPVIEILEKHGYVRIENGLDTSVGPNISLTARGSVALMRAGRSPMTRR